ARFGRRPSPALATRMRLSRNQLCSRFSVDSDKSGKILAGKFCNRARVQRGERGTGGQLAKRVVGGRNWLGGMALSRVDAALWLRAADVAPKFLAPLAAPNRAGTPDELFKVPYY